MRWGRGLVRWAGSPVGLAVGLGAVLAAAGLWAPGPWDRSSPWAQGANAGSLSGAGAEQPGGGLAYEASVLVMTAQPSRYPMAARSRALQSALERRLAQAAGTAAGGATYRVSVRAVAQAPLVVVSAVADAPELASRLAHEAARVLVEQVEGAAAGGVRARLLPGSCSPPAAVPQAARGGKPVQSAR